jgi:hypothetical protein
MAKQLGPAEQLHLLESRAIWVRQELKPANKKNMVHWESP